MATLNVTSHGAMNADQLTIGYDGGSHGSLEVQSQGIASTHQLAIGVDAGSHGSAHVDGAGSQLNVVSPSATAIALLAADANMSATNGGTINIGSGSGTAGSINVMPNGGLVGTGIVQGSVRNSGGTVWPSNALSITGSYTQTSGKLLIEISGKNAGQFGVLDISGSAQLAGTLDWHLTNGYQPIPGEQFVILHTSDLSNNGIALTSAAAALFNLSVDMTNDWVMLTARGAAVAGDYNGNGVVDAADYIIWRKTLGSTTDLHANGDNTGASQGKIDQADYVFWKSRFGATSGSGTGVFADAVPEPNSVALMLMALAFCVRARRLRSDH